jgi:Ca2+-binding RTX toxin-like protein
MKNAWVTLLSVLTVAMLSSTSAVRADVSCPTNPTASDALLHIDNFVPAANGDYYYTIGNFNFFGSSVVGVCVFDKTTHQETLHVILDSNNHLLGWLPLLNNHLCLTSGRDETFVVQTSASVCGITINPLNYAGNMLYQYGGPGADILRGGNGADFIYGGGGNDSITDYTSVGSNPIYSGVLAGESGDDRLFGSPANGTMMDGADGNDGLWDFGGLGDLLNGGIGNECCMFDSNENFSAFDCGPGTDRVRTLGGSKQNCEVADPTCTAVTQNSACFR